MHFYHIGKVYTSIIVRIKLCRSFIISHISINVNRRKKYLFMVFGCQLWLPAEQYLPKIPKYPLKNIPLSCIM